MQTSFKLGEANDKSKDLDDRIEDYERIVDGMDLSFIDDKILKDE